MIKSANFFALLAVILMMFSSIFATTLFQRVQENNASEVEKLIKSGADVNVKDGKGNASLHYAAFLGFVDIARKLIDAGAQVDALGQNSMVPLQFAVAKNHAEVVKLLLEKGANKNQVDAHGFTVLASAVIRGYEQVVRELIAKGADVNVKSKDGLPVFHMVTRATNVNDQARANGLNALLEFGDVDVNQKIGSNQETALHFVLNCSTVAHPDVYDDAYQSVVQALIKKGADVNVKNKHGLAGLYLAVKKNFFKITEMLLKNGASVDEQDKFGQTALFLATANNNENIVRLLAEYNANLNLKHKQGLAPLHIAAIDKLKNVAMALIEKGADINIKCDISGKTPISYSVMDDYPSFILSIKLKSLAKKLADLRGKIGSLGKALETLKTSLAKS